MDFTLLLVRRVTKFNYILKHSLESNQSPPMAVGTMGHLWYILYCMTTKKEKKKFKQFKMGELVMKTLGIFTTMTIVNYSYLREFVCDSTIHTFRHSSKLAAIFRFYIFIAFTTHNFSRYKFSDWTNSLSLIKDSKMRTQGVSEFLLQILVVAGGTRRFSFH